jgi:predicted nucleic acid-binding protein
MPSKTVIYWDTCVFLSVLQKNHTRLPDLKKIVAQAESDRLVIVTSAATIAEASFIDRDSTDDLAKQAEIISQFFENEYIEIWPVDRAIGGDAADIVRRYKGVTPSDAIQVATAFAAKCGCLYTMMAQR